MEVCEWDTDIDAEEREAPVLMPRCQAGIDVNAGW